MSLFHNTRSVIATVESILNNGADYGFPRAEVSNVNRN